MSLKRIGKKRACPFISDLRVIRQVRVFALSYASYRGVSGGWAGLAIAHPDFGSYLCPCHMYLYILRRYCLLVCLIRGEQPEGPSEDNLCTLDLQIITKLFVLGVTKYLMKPRNYLAPLDLFLHHNNYKRTFVFL